MASAERDEDGRTAAETLAARARRDRRAAALRANLNRRKAQTRARDEARRDVPAQDG